MLPRRARSVVRGKHCRECSAVIINAQIIHAQKRVDHALPNYYTAFYQTITRLPALGRRPFSRDFERFSLVATGV
jgi:hypothetical protein